jgi:hypothetical protein
MSTKFPGLAAVSPPPLPQYQFGSFLRFPGDPITDEIVEFKELTAKVHDFLKLQIARDTRDRAERTLCLAGPPGAGKSEGALVAALNFNFAVGVLSASMFAGDTEGKPTQLLDAILEEFSRWSAEQRRRVVVILDDIDLSIMAKDDKTGVSSNTNLLLQRFHYLADNRHVYRNGDGSNIAFIVTLNDASNLRASLYREGRAIWHDHVPTVEDKVNIAWATLAPQTSEERALVDKLARKYRHMPVSFWKALRNQIKAHHARRRLPAGVSDAAAIDRAYACRFPLTADVAWDCARALRANRARDWLAKRGWLSRH